MFLVDDAVHLNVKHQYDNLESGIPIIEYHKWFHKLPKRCAFSSNWKQLVSDSYSGMRRQEQTERWHKHPRCLRQE